MDHDPELTSEEMEAVSGGALTESRKQALLSLIKRSKAGGKSLEMLLSLTVDREAKEYVRRLWSAV